MHRDPRYKLLLLILIAFFGTQVPIRMGMEPYPAIAMPGFPGVGAWDEGTLLLVRTEAIVLFADGDEAPISRTELLGPFPGSFHSTLLLHFQPGGFTADEDRTSSIDIPLPGWHARQRRLATAPDDPEIAAWLRRQASRAFPDRRSAAIRFDWYLDRMSPPEAEPVSRELLGSTTVTLAP